MYSRNVILRYVDAPWRIAFWSGDEAAVILIPSLSGFIFGFPVVGMVVSLSGYGALKFIKGRLGGGMLRHAAYWYLPKIERKLKVKIPSHKRIFIG